MKKNITFTNLTQDKGLLPPSPSSTNVPSWFKDTGSYVENKTQTNSLLNKATIKKCMPVFDAITSGYIIKSPCDVYVKNIDGKQCFQWLAHNALEFHPVEQASLHPKHNGFDYPKWINPWSIKTPRGYSVLIIQPVHRDLDFTIFPAVVDTDKYHNGINFPFTLNDVNFEGVIPYGTPIAQVIPFKRESWHMTFGSKKEIESAEKILWDLKRVAFNQYKNLWRSKKEYK